MLFRAFGSTSGDVLPWCWMQRSHPPEFSKTGNHLRIVCGEFWLGRGHRVFPVTLN
jgi:hypothetical protein